MSMAGLGNADNTQCHVMSVFGSEIKEQNAHSAYDNKADCYNRNKYQEVKSVFTGRAA